MSDDLISRSAFADALCAACNKEYPEEPCEPSECLIRKALEAAPAVDAVPVVHGRWKQVFEELGWADCPHIVHRNTCSICGYVKRTELNKTVKWRYCPNCGAKMDIERKDK